MNLQKFVSYYAVWKEAMKHFVLALRKILGVRKAADRFLLTTSFG